MKYITPTTSETAFNCPHCGVLAKQFWYETYALPKEETRPLPRTVGNAGSKSSGFEKNADRSETESFELWASSLFEDRLNSGLPFLDENQFSTSCAFGLHHLHISECSHCKKIALWQNEKLSFPLIGSAPEPNSDLPDDLKRDYMEASAILDLSPRGAAALMRLVIQKLCKHLGQQGENINSDIKELVASGLDPRLQKALDAVRVIGNNAVHPGQMDISDDRATAESLFRLLNIVADKMISEPKHIDEAYASLPESARTAIDKRDSKAKDK